MTRRRSFLRHLRDWRDDARMPLIAEIKRRSAGAEDLTRGRSTEEIVRAYDAAGAACLSVVTGRWFGGTPDLLAEVASLSSLPILQKDFITSRAAIARAATLGASAVLLTRQLVTRDTLHSLIDCTLAVGMTPFVEVQSAEEIAELDVEEGVIVAVNNQDIRARETTGEGVARGLALVSAARATGASAVVSASAIDSPHSARLLLDAGFDGLLVGTALLRAASLDERLAQFRDELSERAPLSQAS